jgi:hypothetical protein
MAVILSRGLGRDVTLDFQPRQMMRALINETARRTANPGVGFG